MGFLPACQLRVCLLSGPQGPAGEDLWVLTAPLALWVGLRLILHGSAGSMPVLSGRLCG